MPSATMIASRDAGDPRIGPSAACSGARAVALFARRRAPDRAAHLARGGALAHDLPAPRRPRRTRAACCGCCRSQCSPSGARSRSAGRRCPTRPGTTRTARSSTSSSRWSACGSPGGRASSRSGSRCFSARSPVWALLGKVVPTLPGGYRRDRGSRSRGCAVRSGSGTSSRSLGDFALPLALWIAARRSHRGHAAGVRLARRAAAHLVARRVGGGRAGRRRVVRVLRRADRGVARWSRPGCLRRSSSGSRSPCPASRATARALHTRRHDGLDLRDRARGGPARDRRAHTAAAPAPGAAFAGRCSPLGARRRCPGDRGRRAEGGAAWREFTSSTEVGNGAGRFGSAGSNFRWVWWQQAWHGFTHHQVEGTGAGSFQLTNLLYRTSSVDVTTEPHDLPVQFLSETGIVGARAARARALRPAPRLAAPARPRARARADPAGVSPALARRHRLGLRRRLGPGVSRRGRARGTAARRAARVGVRGPRRSGAALAAFGVLLMPWLGHRWAVRRRTRSRKPADAVTLARRARAVDPLLVEPFFTLAVAAERAGAEEPRVLVLPRGDAASAGESRDMAVGRPLRLGVGCTRQAYDNLVHFNGARPVRRGCRGRDRLQRRR